MQAITYSAFGAADDVLKLETVETPAPGPGDVTVALHYSGVNPSDVKSRARPRPGMTALPFPKIIPHSDGAGIITALGEGVPKDRLGQRVWIWNGQWRRPFGTAAESIVVPSAQAVPLLEDTDMQVGATLGIPGLTASHIVFSGGDVAGKTLLIQGAAGTVGYLAVQLAKWAGARVIGTAGPAALDRVRGAGADVALDYSAPDLAAQILTANNGAPIDRIIEVEFGVNIALDTEVIAENGTIVAYGSAKVLDAPLPFLPLMFKAVTLEMALVYILTPDQRRSAIAWLNRALSEHALNSPIDQVFDLADCAEAHKAVEAGGRSGSILLRMPAAT